MKELGGIIKSIIRADAMNGTRANAAQKFLIIANRRSAI